MKIKNRLLKENPDDIKKNQIFFQETFLSCFYFRKYFLNIELFMTAPYFFEQLQALI